MRRSFLAFITGVVVLLVSRNHLLQLDPKQTLQSSAPESVSTTTGTRWHEVKRPSPRRQPRSARRGASVARGAAFAMGSASGTTRVLVIGGRPQLPREHGGQREGATHNLIARTKTPTHCPRLHHRHTVSPFAASAHRVPQHHPLQSGGARARGSATASERLQVAGMTQRTLTLRNRFG